MNTDKYDPQAIRDAFKFLVDEFGYQVSRDEGLFYDKGPSGFRIEYRGNNRRLDLYHDYKDDTFYFVIIRGLETKYPNDHDTENILFFWRLFKSFEPDLDLNKLQPINQTCKDAALKNAELLKKYAGDILRGKQWL